MPRSRSRSAIQKASWDLAGRRGEASNLLHRAETNEENFGTFLEGATQRLLPFNQAGRLGHYGAGASAGGTLESPSIEFGEDPDSLLVENLLASVSQHQRQKNGEQTRNRMRSRVLNGYWVFQAPIGYRYGRVTGRGMMLKRDEPVASILAEGLEGYASGRFETQADVMRFFQAHPLFPKDQSGLVRPQRVANVLNQCCYAGYVEAPNWDVARRPGQHEGLISYETFGRIQERLAGVNRLPKRQNLNADFPLRGFVLCADCETPLTACWSTGTHARHPYYLCPKRGCASYGKSTRRDTIEGEFEILLQSVRPTEGLFKVATAMFRDLWTHRLQQAATQKKALEAQLARIEGQVSQLLSRILDTSVPAVIGAHEEKVRILENDNLLIREKLALAGRPVSSFDQTLRTALTFLANPFNLWTLGRLEDRRAVLKLTFADRLHYKRNEEFRTANLSLPFKVLAGFLPNNSEMAHPTRFERVTFAFGGYSTSFVLAFSGLRQVQKHSEISENPLSWFAIACGDLISGVTYMLPQTEEVGEALVGRITLRDVRSLAEGQEVWDGEVKGFGARRQRSPAVSYILMYRTVEGRQRRFTIGRHGSPWTPDTARDEAKRLLGDVARGSDPGQEKQEKRKAATVSDLCDAYLEDAEAGRLLTRRRVAKKASTLVTDKGRIEWHIKPLLGRLPIAAVTREDVERFMHSVAEGKTAKHQPSGKSRGITLVKGGRGTASRTVGLLGGIFSYAIRKRLRTDNPCTGVIRFADRTRERRLADVEYRGFGEALRWAESHIWPPAVALARFLALTGWRSGEGIALKWTEVDLDRRTAVLADSKTGKSVRPLSVAACDILRSQRGPSALVFPASRGTGTMSGFPRLFAIVRHQARLGPDVTPHVLRHSFASVASDLGYSESTIGALIGHKSGTITGRYVHAADAVLVSAADTVAKRLAVLMDGGHE